MKDNAKGACDHAVIQEEFSKFEGNKKAIKELANQYTFFIAQASLMPLIAKVFGRVLGPKQKMPNPKAGCVVPPNVNLKPLADKLKKTVRLSAKTTPVIQVSLGLESQPETELVDNGFFIYNAIAHAVKDEKQNVKEVMIKTTMGPIYTVGKELVAKTAASPVKKSQKAKEAPKEEKKEEKKEAPKKESKPAKGKKKVE